ncbi:MAG: 23S rRNA (uracil(1939)-C(5))-methyltransferase RlmD [Bacillota bacterium]
MSEVENYFVGEVEDVFFPDEGVINVANKEIRVAPVCLGEQLKVQTTNKYDDHYRGKIVEVMDNDITRQPLCDHYDLCGGCDRQKIDYDAQLKDKEQRIANLLAEANLGDYQYLGIEASPQSRSYRNKMEFSFGDLEIGGQLQLGMHLPGMMYEVVTVDTCQIVDSDFRLILETVIDYFRQTDLKKYHVKLDEGYLRHLVVRKGLNTGEILVNLVTTSELDYDLSELTEILINLDYEGELVSFLQTINDAGGDRISCDQLICHYGRDYYWEELLDFKFKVTPFSFFQPNTYGAEVLYQEVNSLLAAEDKVVFDLYSGTGTISQIIAPQVKEVVGIEQVAEAVDIARENAEINQLTNCSFIVGNVREELNRLEQNPDVIIIDPPRPGIHPDALEQIIDYDCSEIIYVSCNPKSLVSDLEEFVAADYQLKQVKSVDMFPQTHHIENVTKLEKKDQ